MAKGIEKRSCAELNAGRKILAGTNVAAFTSNPASFSKPQPAQFDKSDEAQALCRKMQAQHAKAISDGLERQQATEVILASPVARDCASASLGSVLAGCGATPKSLVTFHRKRLAELAKGDASAEAAAENAAKLVTEDMMKALYAI